VLREAALALLREDDLSVTEHVELALRALLDLGLVLSRGVQLGRETRGPRVVAVSDGAVLDQDAGHGDNLPIDWNLAELGRRALEHVHAAFGRRVADKLVTGGLEQRLELLEGAFLSTRPDEHVEIAELRFRPLVGRVD
jgi:hypothetical protein